MITIRLLEIARHTLGAKGHNFLTKSENVKFYTTLQNNIQQYVTISNNGQVANIKVNRIVKM